MMKCGLNKMRSDLNISQFVTDYFFKPFTIWAIFFNIIIRLTFIPTIFDLVKWILESEIYLAIFIPSFVFSYLRGSLPIYKVTRDIRKAKSQDKWMIPLIVSDKVVIDVALWLSAGLFFAGLFMSFGILDHEAINNKEKYSKLQLELPMLGFVFLPAVSSYFFRDLDLYLRKHGIELAKIDLETMVPIIIMSFFITLIYVAAKNILPN